MTRGELVEFNKELFQKLKKAGVRIDDYKYCGLYREYQEMAQVEKNRKVIFLTLAQRYNISDRQVYNIVNHLKTLV